MRCNRRDDRNFRTGGMHPADVAVEILGQPGAIPGLDILEYARRVRVGYDNVEREAVLFASPGEAFVIVDSSADTQPADQSQTTRVLHPGRLAHIHGISSETKTGVPP